MIITKSIKVPVFLVCEPHYLHTVIVVDLEIAIPLLEGRNYTRGNVW